MSVNRSLAKRLTSDLPLARARQTFSQPPLPLTHHRQVSSLVPRMDPRRYGTYFQPSINSAEHRSLATSPTICSPPAPLTSSTSTDALLPPSSGLTCSSSTYSLPGIDDYVDTDDEGEQEDFLALLTSERPCPPLSRDQSLSPTPPASASGTFSFSSSLPSTPVVTNGPLAELSYGYDGDADNSHFLRKTGTISHRSQPVIEHAYTQCYSSAALSNDLHTYELLRRLCPNGSPTFHQYRDDPPLQILDLGCGEGFWAAEAAMKWGQAGAQVTAFDILDLGDTLRSSLDAEVLARLNWVSKQSFLKPLPFRNDSFDLIRMANLALAIPSEHWYPLLLEVKRVLNEGGRLEIVDDELFFPSIETFSMATHRTAEHSGWSSPISDEDIPSSEDEDEDDLSSNPLVHFQYRAGVARSLEKTFVDMLSQRYNVYRPAHRIIDNLLPKVFGESNARKIGSFHITIPTRDLMIDEPRLQRKDSMNEASRWPTDTPTSTPRLPPSTPSKAVQLLESGKKTTQSPVFASPKAVQLLSKPTRPRSYQPTGFVIMPSTFVPCPPDVLEMYACKNMHNLLSSKLALASYIQEQSALGSQPRISDEEFDDIMWEYDSFKRRRMNWPQDYPGLCFEDDEFDTLPLKPLSSFGLAEGLPFGRRRAQSTAAALKLAAANDLHKVRTIRVFEAVKHLVASETR